MTPQEYFDEHTLDPEFLKKNFSVIWDDKKITIPIYDIKGRLLFCRYRHLEGTAKFTNDKGAHPALFCIHKVKKLPQVVLCEGEPDAMRLWQEGIPAVTSTGGVKTFNSKIAIPLKDKTVYIVLDTDKAGTTSIRKYYEALKDLAKEIKIVDLPSNTKDVSEYFTNGYTKEDFEILLTKSLKFEDWLDAHLPPEFKIELSEDLIAADIPTEEWLIDRILPAEGFTFIYGEEATGKSFYTLDIAHSLVTGNPWLGKHTVNAQTSVLFIDKENTRRRVQKRMRGLGMDTIKGKIHRLYYPEHFELADPKSETGFSEFALYLKRYVEKHNIGCVIIDSFTDLLIGNENDREAVQRFFDAMRQLFANRCILVLHHASKPAQGVSRTSAQRARGSSNIMAQVYSAFFTEKVPKSIGEFLIEQTKSGDSEKITPFIVKLISESGTVTGLEWIMDVVPQELKVQEAKGSIEEILKSTDKMRRQDIINECQGKGISRSTTERALSEMKKDEQVLVEKDGRESVYSWRKIYESEADEDV